MSVKPVIPVMIPVTIEQFENARQQPLICGICFQNISKKNCLELKAWTHIDPLTNQVTAHDPMHKKCLRSFAINQSRYQVSCPLDRHVIDLTPLLSRNELQGFAENARNQVEEADRGEIFFMSEEEAEAAEREGRVIILTGGDYAARVAYETHPVGTFSNIILGLAGGAGIGFWEPREAIGFLALTLLAGIAIGKLKGLSALKSSVAFVLAAFFAGIFAVNIVKTIEQQNSNLVGRPT